MMERRVILESALGEKLQFRRLVGQEKLSELFEFDIDAVSDIGTIDPHELLGTHVSLRVETDGGESGSWTAWSPALACKAWTSARTTSTKWACPNFCVNGSEFNWRRCGLRTEW